MCIDRLLKMKAAYNLGPPIIFSWEAGRRQTVIFAIQ